MIYKQLSPFIHVFANPSARKKFEIEITYSSGGSWFEKNLDRGKKHLLEHCIASRTKDLDFDQFQNFQFANNIMVNAYTAPLTMGVNAQGHFENSLDMISKITEISLNPAFDQKILEQEKEIVLREISERRGDPNYRLHYAIMNEVFEPNSLENHEVLGDSECVASTTISDFEFLHKQNLSKSHFLITLAGGFDYDLAIAKIAEIFELNQPQKSLVCDPSTKDEVNFSVDSPFRDFSFLPIVHELAHDHADVNVYIPLEVNFENKPILKIFDELFLKYYGVLYDRLRNKEGLIYSLGGSFDPTLKKVILNFSCEIDSITKIMDIISDTFSNFDKFFEAQKFEDLKQTIRKKIEISSDTVSSETNFALNSILNYGIVETLDEYLKRLVKVEVKDLKDLYNQIQKGLTEKKVVVSSNKPEIKTLKIN
jgi:predicted Zn-dependent peptidase